VAASARTASALADAFWPGGLSVALPAAPALDRRLLLDGRVAVRVPGPSPAAELARAFGRPLTATSANLPGEPPATTALAVERVFAAALRDGTLTVWRDKASGGLPSTMVVVEGNRARIVREGAVGRESVQKVLETVGVSLDAREAHR
jgi:tRNA A37 threonylcarbamoyladenosine synthetase subunit TsaC/SUA5/YrdC